MAKSVFENLVKPYQADAWVAIPTPLTLDSLPVALDSLSMQIKRLKVTHPADTQVRFAIDRENRMFRVDLKPRQKEANGDEVAGNRPDANTKRVARDLPRGTETVDPGGHGLPA